MIPEKDLMFIDLIFINLFVREYNLNKGDEKK